jgi:predicted TIM-barrel fold metal-dependent hydrolase
MTRWLCLLLLLAAWPAAAAYRGPIIDMHMHASAADEYGPGPMAMCMPFVKPLWDQRVPYAQAWDAAMKKPSCADPVWSPKDDEGVLRETLAAMDRLGIVRGLLSGTPERMKAWRAAAPERFIPGMYFQLDQAPPTPAQLRKAHADGDLAAFGEVTNQYAGVAPDDPRMEPYWSLMEELDVPVGIHIGTGPPGVIHLGSPGYRASLHSALTLEPVLVKHPRLRVWIMHAGYPMLDDLLALMYAHPQVYVDTGVIAFTESPAAFRRYLQAIVEGGFGKRVMFGSDQMIWPGTMDRSVSAIADAPFLDDAQKRDIFHDNAARFLRLPPGPE